MTYRIDEIPMQLAKATTDRAISLMPYVSPASADDEIARRAVAEIELEDGYDRCAQHRLHGSYDGDTEHRIALAAIKLFRKSLKEAPLSASGGE